MANKKQQNNNNNKKKTEETKKRKREEEEEQQPEVDETEEQYDEEEAEEYDNEENGGDVTMTEDGDEDNETSTSEPPKKMTKREKKEKVIEKKRLKNPNIDKSIACKRLWEEMLQHVSRNCKKGERPKDDKSKRFLHQIVEILREDWGRYACQHDMSRVVQTILKLGSDEHVLEAFRALKPKLRSLAKDKFGHNIVMKLLTYVLDKSRFNSGDKKTITHAELRKEFFDELFKGQMKLMMKQKFPATVIDHAFRTIWTPAERILFLQEFYGSDFWLSDISQIQSTDLVSVSLKDKLAEFPGKRKPVVLSLNLVVAKIVEKRLFDLELAQKLILDFFENGEPGQIQNIIYDLCEKDAIPFIFHTFFGCKIAIYCTAYGAARDRKRIIKSLCQNTAEGDEESIVLRTAKIFYGSVFLRYLLSVTDDTKKSKGLLKDIEKNMLELLSDQHGQKVILYLFNQTHRTCNENRDLELLNPPLREEVLPRTNNEGKRVVSMKPQEDIFKELAAYMAPHVSETFYNNVVLLGEKNAQFVAFEALTNPMVPNKKKLFEKIVAAALGDVVNIISDPVASKTISLLIRNQKVEQVSAEYPLFSKMLYQKIKEEKKSIIDLIIEKQAGFIFAAILTSGSDGGDSETSEALNADLTAGIDKLKQALENKKPNNGLKFLVNVYNTKNGIVNKNNNNNNKKDGAKTPNKKVAEEKTKTPSKKTPSNNTKTPTKTPSKKTPNKKTPKK